MTATASVSPTGDPYLDGILSGTKWGVTSLTFSFPTDPSFYSYTTEAATNFKAFTTVQQEAVREVLQNYAAVANLTFTEVTETSTQHGELRYAESDSPGTAWAYYPSTASQGGDAWFNNSKHYYDNPVAGNYAYLTMLHETGHALGLKHPQEAMGSFGAMPLDHDSLEYSVMSYRSYIGASTTSGYTNGATSYPQTLMMYDIAAVQEMYGANYATNGGDTVYKWSATTGEMYVNGAGQGAPAGNKIFMTVWDGGGHDTYDFSNYTTNLKVDLSPGGWTTVSTVQLADLNGAYAPGTKLAAGNIANAMLYQENPASLIEDVIGGSGSDRIIGNIADNHLAGGLGNDYLDGGAGNDTAVYSGLRDNFVWVHNTDGSWMVTDLRSGSPDGIDTLWNIELLQFGDTVVAIDSYTPAGRDQYRADDDIHRPLRVSDGMGGQVRQRGGEHGAYRFRRAHLCGPGHWPGPHRVIQTAGHQLSRHFRAEYWQHRHRSVRRLVVLGERQRDRLSQGRPDPDTKIRRDHRRWPRRQHHADRDHHAGRGR